MHVQFSSESQDQIRELLSRYPTKQASLIPALYLAQKEFGSLTDQVLEMVAKALDVPVSRVMNTATFYTMLLKKPVGKFHLQLCHNVSCYLMGSDSMLDVIKDKIGIEPGQTSRDGLFTLDTVECLAACGTAPVMMVNEAYHENLAKDGLTNLLDALIKEGSK